MRQLAALVVVLAAVPAFAQYNKTAGFNAPEAAPLQVRDDRDRTGEGGGQQVVVDPPPVRDEYGNAKGSQYDLAVDGAFEGQTILIVDQYHGAYGLEVPFVAGLKQKGFNVVRYSGVPTVAELKKGLRKSNQFWLISSCSGTAALTDAHHAAVKAFFDAGHGVYLWGDNDPCNEDAHVLGMKLVKAGVRGDLFGDQNVGISRKAGQPGVVRDHLLSTGVEMVYEGITVATVNAPQGMTPIIYGSARNVIAAAYDKEGKRLLIDGGFTRLAHKWNSAGTGRYITNAAAWLANHERFGDQVVAAKHQKRQGREPKQP